MDNNIVSQTISDSNNMEKELLEYFRDLDVNGKRLILQTAKDHCICFKQMMKETGQDKKTAGERFPEWVLGGIANLHGQATRG